MPFRSALHEAVEIVKLLFEAFFVLILAFIDFINIFKR